MSKQEKKDSVPRLRFPEFRNTRSWKKLKLIDVTDKAVKWSFIGGPFGSNLKSSDYVADGIRVIQLQNIGDAEFHNDYKIFTSEEKADELLSNNIYPGDIILSKMGDPVGRACLIPNFHSRYVMCSDGIRLVVDEKSHSKYFIYSLINSARFRALVEKTATGSTRKRIGLDELKNLPMLTPIKNEQQKIASCLSSIDDLITAQTQKIDSLKTYKKGLMQELFPIEGEAVPKLRFPEFQGAGDWEKAFLGNIAKLVSGGTPSKDVSEYWGGDIPWISAASMHDTKIEKSESNITELAVKDGAKIVKKGTLLILVRGSMLHKRIPIGIATTAVAFNQDVKAFTLNNTISEEYLLCFLVASESKLLDIVTQTGIGAGKLDTEELNNFTIYIPPSKKEQKKVADFISTIDELITAQTEKLELVKAHKKGLMQQVFLTHDGVVV